MLLSVGLANPSTADLAHFIVLFVEFLASRVLNSWKYELFIACGTNFSINFGALSGILSAFERWFDLQMCAHLIR